MIVDELAKIGIPHAFHLGQDAYFLALPVDRGACLIRYGNTVDRCRQRTIDTNPHTGRIQMQAGITALSNFFWPQYNLPTLQFRYRADNV